MSETPNTTSFELTATQAEVADPTISIGSVAPGAPEEARAAEIASTVELIYGRVEDALGTPDTHADEFASENGLVLVPLILPEREGQDPVWLGMVTSPADLEQDYYCNHARVEVGQAELDKHRDLSVAGALGQIERVVEYVPGIQKIGDEFRRLAALWQLGDGRMLSSFRIDFSLQSPDSRVDTEGMKFPPEALAGASWHAIGRDWYSDRTFQIKGTPAAGFDVDLSAADLAGLERMVRESKLPSELEDSQ